MNNDKSPQTLNTQGIRNSSFLPLVIKEHNPDGISGGSIVISTNDFDRSNDRVFPQGVQLENYMKNPIVLWAHDSRSVSSTIGQTKALHADNNSVIVDRFELRPAATPNDPQNITLMLWDNKIVPGASIGFILKLSEPNERGGLDFLEWELLEWSMVPVPDNQNAMRLAYEGVGIYGQEFTNEVGKVLQSDLLSEMVIKSIVADFGQKKYSGFTQKPEVQPQQKTNTESLMPEENEILETQLLEDHTASAFENVLTLAKLFNDGEISKSQVSAALQMMPHGERLQKSQVDALTEKITDIESVKAILPQQETEKAQLVQENQALTERVKRLELELTELKDAVERYML